MNTKLLHKGILIWTFIKSIEAQWTLEPLYISTKIKRIKTIAKHSNGRKITTNIRNKRWKAGKKQL